MANHKSAEKRHRQSLKRRARNRVAKTSLRNAVKAARSAAEANDPKARDLARAAEKLLAKAAAKGIVNKKAASRLISRTSRASKKK